MPVTSETLQQAIQTLAQKVPAASQIVLFGSCARGDASTTSDIDLLVIEPEVQDRAQEMVRLRRILRPLRVPIDILVYSQAEAKALARQPGTAFYWAMKEGRVVYG